MPGDMKRAVFKKLEIASLVGGLALFAYLIKQTGLDTLASYLGMMGWGFALILALSALRNATRTASWYFAIEPGHRNIRFWPLHNIMLAGEAIKYLTATGPLLGEPAKAAMVRRQVPLLHGVSSVVVESMTYYLSVFLFMLSGLPALAWAVEVPDRLRVAGYVAATVIALVILITVVAVRRRWYVFARLLEMLAARTALGKRERVSAAIIRTRAVEENIYSFYDERRGAFYLILGLNIWSHLINVVEVYLILALMGFEAGLSVGFVIEAATKVINMAFFFVPTRAGVYESGNALVLEALGMTAAGGLALAIIRKIRAFVWVAYGIAVIAIVALRDRRASATSPTDEVKSKI
jgi:lysylphosphatidylglycerol synthase-like protein